MAAYAVPVCVLPSAVWRAVGAFSGDLTVDGTPRWYMLMLSVVSVGLGLLTLGLVHRWGERLPDWVPGVGRRSVPVRAAVVPAVTGALVLLGLVVLAVYQANTITEINPDSSLAVMTDSERVTDRTPLPEREEAGEVFWTYGPLAAWPFLLLVVAYAYNRRRRS
ncbi:hypothetical protein J4H86_19865 [Spiractinospora alimapuensis]|uniref:hypothetical protein n=1 Tax=Spiractinospora alimapuensis TaxID=2820884 RepID=UPI001F3CA265|nr:hypothetical protein [Spiractinospora alimapuensis]QVQ51079.1 hypothetical protein J4H86_19865 [Spiractinospora alimapuensis]